MMKSSDFIELINEIENKIPVDKWVINGISIWPLVRIQLYFDLFYGYVSDSSDGKNKNLPVLQNLSRALKVIQGTAKYYYGYFGDKSHNSRPNSPADVVFLSSGVNRLFLGDSWYDKFFDPLIEHLREMKRFPLMMELSHEYHVPRHSPSIFIQPHLDRIAIRNLFLARKGSCCEENLMKFSDIAGILKEKKLNIGIPDLTEIRRQVVLIHAYSEYFKTILRRVKPLLGFTVCYFSLSGMAFNRACRELGITSVEMQHGVQDDHHPAYARWNRIPISGYDMLPARFWCWSQSEANAIDKWNKSVSQWHRPIVGGNPWVEVWQSGEADFISYYDQKVKKIKHAQNSSLHVLLTLQAGLSDFGNVENIIQSIKRTQYSWRWWIRLHPTALRDKDKIKTMLTQNNISEVEIEGATTLPLYSLLRNVDVHITYSSATIIEAESFGVPSVVTSEYGSEFFPDQIAEGWVLKAYTSEEIIKAIQFQADRKGLLKQSRSGKSILGKNAISAINGLIEEGRSLNIEQRKN